MGAPKKGAELVTALLAADSLWIAFGDDDTAYANTNTTLASEIDRAAATLSQVTTTNAKDTLRASCTFTVSGSQTAKEVGILDAATGGSLLVRIVLSASNSLTDGQLYAVIIDVPVAIA